MSGFRTALASGTTLLFDGAMGTMLIDAGLSEGEVPEAWTLTRPDVLVGVHLAYLEAGADVVLTNTFGANRVKLAASPAGRDVPVRAANERAVFAARAALAAGGFGDRWVAGDVGPTGAFLPPVGTLEPEEATAAFREQAQALAGAGVDLFLVETMTDLREAVLAVRGIREVSDLPLLATLTFDRKPRGYFTIMGDAPARAAETLLQAGADGVGANCTLSAADLVDLAAELRAATGAPVLVQPNAGAPSLEAGRAVYRQEPAEWAMAVARIAAAGANAVGGCCGTTPDFVRAAREVLR